MSDTKMLQAILDGQKTLSKKIDTVNENVQKNGKRIDKLGLQMAYLEDDAPTREEFDDLEKRVKKVEKSIASV